MGMAEGAAPAKTRAMTILIALGSNRAHGRHGPPPAILGAALAALADRGVGIVARSRIHGTKPLGPGGRNYANRVAVVETHLPPYALLDALHRVETEFGRRRQRRWGARVLDLDLLAYGVEVRPDPFIWRAAARAATDGGGAFVPRGLVLPHPQMHRRPFVLAPALEVAPDWQHPVLGLTVRQMAARLKIRTPGSKPAVDPGAAPA